MNLSQEKKNKILAAAELIDRGDMAVLKKILEFEDYLEEHKVAEGQIVEMMERAKEMREFCETCATETEEAKEQVGKMKEVLARMEAELKRVDAKTLEQTIKDQGEDMAERFADEIREIRELIPLAPDFKTYDEKLAKLEKELPEVKEEALDPEKTADRLETLKGEARLDKKAIKGLDDYEEISKLARQPKGTQFTGISGVKEIVAGTGISVDNSKPGRPIVSATGGGGGTFLDLTDTPSSYSGQSGKVPAVKATEDGLEFIAVSGSGTVTEVSSADANLTVATGTTTPVLTIVNSPTVTIADAGGDTTTFPLLGTAATGNLAPATDAGLTYNATTNALTTTTFVGALTGNASTATALATPRTIGGTSFDGTANIVPATITVADTTDATSFVALFESATGDLGPKTDAGITYNASNGTLTATAFSGPLTGNVTGDASGNAGTVTVANEATDTTCFPLFATAASGSLAPKTNTNLTFNSNTGVLTSASAVLTTADINGGTVDGAVIGGASAAAVTGTTITANTGFMPDADDGAYLGQSGTAFADLFLASGGIINWAAGNATLTHSSGLLTSNVPVSLGTSNAFTCGTIELGAASDTTVSRSAAGVIAVEGVVIPSISSTNTLTNKRITKRVGTTTSSATPTINTDNVDYYSLTAQAADITSFTTNLSGTPTDNQTLWISITGTAARAITWGSSFEASTVALPTTTVSTDRLDVGFVWNTATSKWRCVAKA